MLSVMRLTRLQRWPSSGSLSGPDLPCSACGPTSWGEWLSHLHFLHISSVLSPGHCSSLGECHLPPKLPELSSFKPRSLLSARPMPLALFVSLGNKPPYALLYARPTLITRANTVRLFFEGVHRKHIPGTEREIQNNSVCGKKQQ